MFESSYNALLEHVETIVQAATLGEILRGHLGDSNRVEERDSALAKNLERVVMPLLPWREYDHCANVTRLYSVFEVFISAFVRDVCSALPICIRPYSTLPERVRKAQRVGVGRIILELDEKKYHKGIVQEEILASYLQSLNDAEPYKLLPEPFLVQKNALRLPRLLEILADIGFEKIHTQILSHKLLGSYLPLTGTQDERRTALYEKLDDFIDTRNDAAHSDIGSTWSVERLRSAAYLVRDLCMVLVDIGESEFAQRSLDAGLLPKIGTIATAYQNGDVVIVAAESCALSVGDEVILNRAGVSIRTSVKSLQVDKVDFRRVKVSEPKRIGVQFTIKGKLDDAVHVRPENVPANLDKVFSLLVSSPEVFSDEQMVVDSEEFSNDFDDMYPYSTEVDEPFESYGEEPEEFQFADDSIPDDDEPFHHDGED